MTVCRAIQNSILYFLNIDKREFQETLLNICIVQIFIEKQQKFNENRNELM